MSLAVTRVSVRGMSKDLPSFGVDNNVVVVSGKLSGLRRSSTSTGSRRATLPDPEAVLNRADRFAERPDIFHVCAARARHRASLSLPSGAVNLAAIPLTTYEHWLSKQITPAARRNIKAAEKRGVVVKAAEYDDAYVRGIMAIYNESPIRQGRRFWHYGKDFASVRAENGTYADRSTFLAAYVDGEMVGYLKMVWDERTAAIMQVMSQMKCYDKRPNNALLAEAVRQACARGKEYLLYEAFVYGKKSESSLTEYKRSNGFVRMDLPRYLRAADAQGSARAQPGTAPEPEGPAAGLADVRVGRSAIEVVQPESAIEARMPGIFGILDKRDESGRQRLTASLSPALTKMAGAMMYEPFYECQERRFAHLGLGVGWAGTQTIFLRAVRSSIATAESRSLRQVSLIAIRTSPPTQRRWVVTSCERFIEAYRQSPETFPGRDQRIVQRPRRRRESERGRCSSPIGSG